MVRHDFLGLAAVDLLLFDGKKIHRTTRLTK
jgi:hypothetical protein